MKKTAVKKLSLSRETLLHLEARQVHGGTTAVAIATILKMFPTIDTPSWTCRFCETSVASCTQLAEDCCV
jgi:hypothetical protein